MASKSKLFDKYLGRFHRNSQMNKVEHEVVHQGWMTKSPPQRKLFGRTVSRGKWKRRNFVLCKPAGSLPGQVELNYYSDEHCTRKKGTIDLEQCDQIIESLNSDHFRNLFAIKTVCKSKERTYYLATETESEMSRWVRNLCSVCGLKQEDSPEDIPEPQRDRQKEKTTQPQMMTRVPVNQSSNFERQVSTDSYIPLDQCRSGNPATSRRDSIPDETAPSPPSRLSQGSSHRVSTDSADYKVPPPARTPHITFDTSYVVPRGTDLDDVYDFPPKRSSPCMSRSSGGSSDRPVTPQSLSTYDVPPSRSSPQLPPSRPPRPAPAAPHNEYQNLPTNSHAFPLDLNAVPTPPRAVPAADPPQLFDSYDFPKPQNGTPGDKRESNINIVPSPPKACSVARGNKHSYINAATGYVPDNTYLDMAGETSHDPTYTDMTPTPPVPLPRPPETLPSSDLYASPPAARPVVVRSSMGTPRGVSVAVQPQGQENAMNNIWSTHRTKSFKRNQNGTRSSQPPISTVVPRVGVHSKSPAMHLPHRDGDVSSDDEGRQPIQRVPGVQSVPPPPPPEEKELKYLDLDLEESSDKESIKVKNSTSLANSTPTEYREIDFVKTEALSNTKKWGDDQRQLEKQASS